MAHGAAGEPAFEGQRRRIGQTVDDNTWLA